MAYGLYLMDASLGDTPEGESVGVLVELRPFALSTVSGARLCLLQALVYASSELESTQLIVVDEEPAGVVLLLHGLVGTLIISSKGGSILMQRAWRMLLPEARLPQVVLRPLECWLEPDLAAKGQWLSALSLEAVPLHHISPWRAEAWQGVRDRTHGILAWLQIVGRVDMVVIV